MAEYPMKYHEATIKLTAPVADPEAAVAGLCDLFNRLGLSLAPSEVVGPDPIDGDCFRFSEPCSSQPENGLLPRSASYVGPG